MDFDLTHELLLGPASLQRCLLNDFGSRDCFVITLYKFVAFGKASLTQELALDILSITDLSVLMLDLFLHNLGGGVLLRM